MLATVANVTSTSEFFDQAGSAATSRQSGTWVDNLQFAVCVVEILALATEGLQIFRQGKGRQYRATGIWNFIDISSSVCLIVAAFAHLSDQQQMVANIGSIGVATKWIGCK